MAEADDIRAAADRALAEFTTGVTAIRERGDKARDAMYAAAATVTSPDGAVTATVGAEGTLKALAFGPAATPKSPQVLAEQVVETARAARAAALDEAAQQVGGLVGTDSEAVAVLRRQRAELTGPEPVPAALEGFDGRGR